MEKPANEIQPEKSPEVPSSKFDPDLIKKYPRSNRRVAVDVLTYGIRDDDPNSLPKGTTVHISPYGLEFRSNTHYEEGTLLKIHVAIPDYWARKQRFVDYGRIDTPGTFKMLGKVISSEEIGKRGKRKMILVQTVNMDNVDAQVLKSFLQEG